MTDTDFGPFVARLTRLAEVLDASLTPGRIAGYVEALQDVALDDLVAAITVSARESPFFPKPSELREVLDGSAEDRAEVAWTAVVRLVRRYGYPGIDGRGAAPEFPDEATRRAAMELYGGWRGLCENLPSSGPEMLGTAKLFKASFAAYALRDAVAPMLPPSKDEARALLGNVKRELDKRALTTGKL